MKVTIQVRRIWEVKARQKKKKKKATDGIVSKKGKAKDREGMEKRRKG